MSLILKNKNNVIFDVLNSYDIAPVYTRAITIHRTHKDLRMIIKPGNYLYDIYRDKSRHMVLRKSTQSRISEYLICRAFYRAEIGRSVLYVMPTDTLKNQFVKERVDRVTLNSQYYKNIIGQADKKLSESMSMKQIGKGVIAYIGSNSAVNFASFPADDVIIDEYNLCDQDLVLMAPERQSNSTDKTNIEVANPTLPNYGIDILFEKSDKKLWNVKCPSCGEYIHPDFFDHIIMEVDNNMWMVRDPEYDGYNEPRALCHKCRSPFDTRSDGIWVPSQKSDSSGYHISKMFSTSVTLKELVKSFEEGLSNESKMQRVYNGDFGLPYISKGAKIDSSMLDECIDESYNLPISWDKPSIAGIDVGSVFNIIISDPVGKNILYIGELPVQDINEIRDLFRQYFVRLFVIDALPETRIARQIIARNRHGFMNYYSNTKNELTINMRDNIISTNRTVCLDAIKEAIVTKEFKFPANAKTIPRFYDQMTSSTRIYNETNDTFSWVESGPDHYFHAFSYLLLAKKLLVMAK